MAFWLYHEIDRIRTCLNLNFLNSDGKLNSSRPNCKSSTVHIHYTTCPGCRAPKARIRTQARTCARTVRQGLRARNPMKLPRPVLPGRTVMLTRHLVHRARRATSVSILLVSDLLFTALVTQELQL